MASTLLVVAQRMRQHLAVTAAALRLGPADHTSSAPLLRADPLLCQPQLVLAAVCLEHAEQKAVEALAGPHSGAATSRVFFVYCETIARCCLQRGPCGAAAVRL